MRRPSLHAVALALLVVTSGCSGFGSQMGDSTTTAETTAAEDGGVALAPGLSKDGVEDAAALASAHRDRLGDESLTLDSRNAERYENGSVRTRTDMTVRTAANQTRYRVAVNTTESNWLGGPEGAGELWANGTAVFNAHEENGTMTFNRRLGPQSESVDPREYLLGDLTSSDRLLVLFTAFEGERVERMDDGNATVPERYRVTATDLAHPDFVGPDDAAVRNATLDAVIESDGSNSALVRKYALRYETTIEGETVRVIKTTRFSHVGDTAVERPKWYTDAANRTD